MYLVKARRFQATAEAAHAGENWDGAISASVHAVINGLDAVCVHHLGKRAAEDDHEAVLDLLDGIEAIPAEHRAALERHARGLLGMKHVAEYDDRLCDERESVRALDAMKRAMERIEALVSARQ